MRRYQTLYEGIEEQHAYALLQLLAGKSPTEMLGILEDIFFSCTGSHWDEGAQNMLTLVMRHLSDMELLTHAAQQNQRGPLQLPDDKHGETKIHDAECRAVVARATKARALFQMVAAESPTGTKATNLPETKRVLFAEIANGWATADDAEADICVEFILTTPLCYDEEESLRYATVRKMTEGGFPISRLVNAIATFGGRLAGSSEGRRILETLAHGWAKHAYAGDIANAFAVLEPLFVPSLTKNSAPWIINWSDALTKSMRAAGATTKPIDDAILEMLFATGHYDVPFEYSEFNVVNLHINETVLDQNAGLRNFAGRRNTLAAWLGKNRKPGAFRVNLWYTGTPPDECKNKFEIKFNEVL